MVRTKNKPRPEVVLQGRMDTLKKLNNVGRRIAVQVLKAMDVDTHEFDGPFDLVSEDMHGSLFAGGEAFYGAWQQMLSGDQANETFDKLWVLIHNSEDVWKPGCGPGMTGGM